MTSDLTTHRPDGVRIPGWIVGEGRPLLLVPGMGTGARVFGTLPRTLARLGWRAVTFDPPGFGRAREGAPAWSFDAAIEDLGRVLDAAGIEATDVLGISLGGKISLAFAARCPGRVRSAFLYGTQAVRRSSEVLDQLDAAFGLEEDQATARALRPLLFGPTFLARRPVVVETILQAYSPSPAEREATRAQIEAMRTVEFAELLPRVRARVVCHAGLEDRLVAATDVEATAAGLVRGEYRPVPVAGHSMLLENPAVSLKVLGVPAG